MFSLRGENLDCCKASQHLCGRWGDGWYDLSLHQALPLLEKKLTGRMTHEGIHQSNNGCTIAS